MSPAGGIRRYTRELLRALVTLPVPGELVVLGGPEDLDLPEGVSRVPEPWHPPTNAGWMLVGLPMAARRAAVNVLHAPAYTAPFLAPCPIVLTIHDVSYARHPEWFPYRRDPLRRAFYRRSALSASVIVTDSAFSAAEIHAAYGVDPANIVIVPLGVDGPAFARPRGEPGALPAGVTRPFVLHVGDLHERRNLPMVLDAVLTARRRGGATGHLMLALAGVDRGLADRLIGQAERAGAPNAVAVLGAVRDATLLQLYHTAAALVYPSFYEGFGLPLLEAMAAGLPVIASRAACIPEVVGDAGVLLEPDDTIGWADAMAGIVSDAQTAANWRARGLERVRGYGWERTASRTLAVYQRVARNRPLA